MDGDNAVDVDEFIVAGLEQFGLGMINGARPERTRLAEDEKFAADGIPVFHPALRLPPAAMEVRGTVIEDAFEHGTRAALPAFDPRGDDLSADGRGFF